ncbi:MAG TPA: YncE family protein [Asticcacaulis sp.]|nr:YncE family protein [Asticcacaulis sp.]
MKKIAYCLIGLSLAAFPVAAQTVISANDGKQILVDGVQTVPDHPAPDNISILKFSKGTAHVVQTLNLPTSVIGPPASVAITPDGQYAIVSAARRIAADPKQIEPDDKVTVVSLTGKKAKIVQHIQAGAGASGIAISPDGRTVLIANRAEGTVSVFSLAKGRLTAVDKIDLDNPQSAPAMPIFYAKGKRALLTRDGDNLISILAVDNGKVTILPESLSPGLRPYEISIAGDQHYAVTACIGGGGKTVDSLKLIDLTGETPKVVDSEEAGLTPEGVRMSPDGHYVAITVNNGSNAAPTDANYHKDGRLQVWRITDGKLKLAAEAPMGGWGQGVAWRADSRALLVQSMRDRKLQPFTFDGKTLHHGKDIAMPAGPAGIVAGR